MSKEADNKATVGRWFTGFWGNPWNPDIIDQLAAPDMLLQYSLHAPRRGREDIKAFMFGFREGGGGGERERRGGGRGGGGGGGAAAGVPVGSGTRHPDAGKGTGRIDDDHIDDRQTKDTMPPSAIRAGRGVVGRDKRRGWDFWIRWQPPGSIARPPPLPDRQPPERALSRHDRGRRGGRLSTRQALQAQPTFVRCSKRRNRCARFAG